MAPEREDALTNKPVPDSGAGHAYKPKPPLWRPARERRRSPLRVALTALGMLLFALGFTAVALERHLLSGPASATPVTILAIENISHADEDFPGFITYRVTLPDGRVARFASQRTYQPGTRLMAMVSRGRLTRRIIVTSPYVVLPPE